MIIKYIGHACFKIRDNETGFSIMFDPYKEGVVPGYRPIKDTANMILCSHDHDDHCGVESVIKEENPNNPYKVEVIDTFHDPEKGKLRGSNKIHIVTHKESGEKVVHYGDTGEILEDLLTDENLELLKDADIALIPVGNIYTYDAKQTLALMEATKPKVMIPMHYRCDALKFGYPNIESIENFLDEAASQNKDIYSASVYFFDSSERDFEKGILAIRPQNVYL